MGIIDIDRMYDEMKNTMENNFTGTLEERFEHAKELYLEEVGDYIDQNKDGLIKDIRESGEVEE